MNKDRNGDPCGDYDSNEVPFSEEDLKDLYEHKLKFNVEVLKLDNKTATRWAKKLVKILRQTNREALKLAHKKVDNKVRSAIKVSIRNANWEDFDAIESICRICDGTLGEFQDYRSKYFTDKGNRREVCTHFPDHVFVAVSGSRIVGHVQFYTDCTEGNEHNVVAVNVDSTLSKRDQDTVRRMLEKAVEEEEP